MKRVLSIGLCTFLAVSAYAQSTAIAVNPAVFFPFAAQVNNPAQTVANGGFPPSALPTIAKFDHFSPVSAQGASRDWACNGLNSWNCLKSLNPYFTVCHYWSNPMEVPANASFHVGGHDMTWYKDANQGNHGISGDNWLSLGLRHPTFYLQSPGDGSFTIQLFNLTNSNYRSYWVTNAAPSAINGQLSGGVPVDANGLDCIFLDGAGFPGTSKDGTYAEGHMNDQNYRDCPSEYVSSSLNCSDWVISNPTANQYMMRIEDELTAAGVKSEPNWTFGAVSSDAYARLDGRQAQQGFTITHPPPLAMAECLGTCAGSTGIKPFMAVEESGGLDQYAATTLAMTTTKIHYSNFVSSSCIDMTATPFAWRCSHMLSSNIGTFLQGYNPATRNMFFGWSMTNGSPYFPTNNVYYTNFHLGYARATADGNVTSTVANHYAPVNLPYYEVNYPGDSAHKTAWMSCFTDGCVVSNIGSDNYGITITVPGGPLRACDLENLVLNGPTVCDSATPVSSFNMGRSSTWLILNAGKSVTNSDNPVTGSSDTQVVVNSAPFPNAQNGSTYTQIVSGTGGSATPSYTCSIVSGSLPTGVTESSECHYTGTPSANGTFTFTVRVTDANSSSACPGLKCGDQANTVVISPVQQDAVGTDSFTDGSAPRCVGVYGMWEMKNDGTTTNCLKTTGTKIYGDPNSTDGWLVRRPASENYTVNQYSQIKFVDMVANSTEGLQMQGVACQVGSAVGQTRTAYEFLTYKVGTTQYTALVRLPAPAGGGTITVASTSSIDAANPVTWSANDLAKCQTLNGTVYGLQNGTVRLSYVDPSPLTGGTPGIMGAGGDSTHATMDDAAFGNIPTPTLTSTTPPSPCTTGDSYTYPLTATGGTAPYTFAKTSGTFPTGISISGTNLTGTCSSSTGSPFSFALAATDAAMNVSPAVNMSIAVNDPPSTVSSVSITTINSSTTIVGRQACVQMNATGGVTPYSWSISVGSLPAGLTLTASTGQICGTPTTLGTSHFTARVDDSAASPSHDTKAFDLTVTRLGGGRSRFRLH